MIEISFRFNFLLFQLAREVIFNIENDVDLRRKLENALDEEEDVDEEEEGEELGWEDKKVVWVLQFGTKMIIDYVQSSRRRFWSDWDEDEDEEEEKEDGGNGGGRNGGRNVFGGTTGINGKKNYVLHTSMPLKTLRTK